MVKERYGLLAPAQDFASAQLVNTSRLIVTNPGWIRIWQIIRPISRSWVWLVDHCPKAHSSIIGSSACQNAPPCDPTLSFITTSAPALRSASFHLVAFSRKTKDGKLDNGTPTTSFVLVAETISATAGVKFNHILYRGSGPVVSGVLGGEIQTGVLDSPAVIQQVKGGKLKALAVTTAKRSAALPDVPTIAELGYPGYDAPIWTALMAPKGTPAPVLGKLRAAVGDILKDKDMVEKMHALGMDPGDADAAALSRRIAGDIARWSQVAKAANIQPE